MRNELYFTTSATESEHGFIEEMIREFCINNNIEVKYYRKFKNGHVPMERECKVTGNITAFKKFCRDNSISIENVNKKESWNGKKLEKWLVDDLKRL
jgi:hypothetical protein